jgi:hypothetical protein
MYKPTEILHIPVLRLLQRFLTVPLPQEVLLVIGVGGGECEFV